jgi:hypothetical protein
VPIESANISPQSLMAFIVPLFVCPRIREWGEPGFQIGMSHRAGKPDFNALPFF